MEHRFFLWKIVGAVGRQWWFLILFLLPQVIPPFTTRGYELHEWRTVNAYILTHPIKYHMAAFQPIFQIIPLVLLTAIFFAGKKVTRVFSAYVALTYFLVAFLQNTSISETYGFSVCIANVITFLALAGLWFWEAIFPKNNFEIRQKYASRYWAIPLALLAFWRPVNPMTLLPDFNPAYILTSGSGLSFCMSTPLILAILIIHFPQVNKTVFLSTGFIGVFMSLGNFILEFVIYPTYWWVGILHIPLFTLSMYSVVISFTDLVRLARNTASN